MVLRDEGAPGGGGSKTKFMRTILASTTYAADRDAPPHLTHGKETQVRGGRQAHQGQSGANRQPAPRARDFSSRRYRFGGWIYERTKASNRRRSSARAKLEHSIGHQACVRLPEGALPWADQEPASVGSDGGAGQSVHCMRA